MFFGFATAILRGRIGELLKIRGSVRGPQRLGKLL
jgi:hypothetical protein